MKTPMPPLAGLQSRGFSLIEVLVALLVLTMGILGITSLQTLTLKHSHSSFQRTVAVVQANDLVERLWAEICELPGNGDDIRDEWRLAHQNGDLDQWQGELELVSSSGETPFRYEITINWTDARLDSAEQFQYQASIPEMSNCP
ncbi:MAG: type IV pilus modification protein PilV [Wenzhouxiangella sp.]